MGFEWSYLDAVMILSWLAMTTSMGIGPIVLAAGAIFSGALPVSMMFLVLLTLVSFLISSRQGKKRNAVLSQLYFGLRLLFLFVSLFGVALQGSPYSSLFIFIGLVLSLPSILWTLVFERHEHGMRLQAFLYSIMVPAMVTLNILLRIKAEMKAEWPQAWDLTLMILGCSTFLAGSIFALMKRRNRSIWVHLSEAWLGLGMFVLVVDSEQSVKLAVTALSVLMMSAPLLVSLGGQLGRRIEIFSRVVLLGMPGFLTYTSVYYSIKSIVTLSVHWIWIVILAFVFQAFAVTLGSRIREQSRERVVMIRFSLVIATQFVCALSLFWLERIGRL